MDQNDTYAERLELVAVYQRHQQLRAHLESGERGGAAWAP
jgi:hypothetical protein